MAPDDQPRLDPHIAEAVRDAYVRPIDGATAQQHLNAIVAAARAPVSGRRRRPWRALAAAAAAVFALPASLAVAGVSLPAAVERPYSAVGIGLPHQEQAAPVKPSAPAATVVPTPTETPKQGASGKPAPGAYRKPAGRHRGRGKASGSSGRGKSAAGNAGGGSAGRGNRGKPRGGGAGRGNSGAAGSGRGNAGGGAARRGNSGRGARSVRPAGAPPRSGSAAGRAPSRSGPKP